MADDLIAPAEHYPMNWEVKAASVLTGSVAFAFTAGGTPPTAAALWTSAIWTDSIPAATRIAQLVVAGSAAAGQGTHPGVGDFTVWLRYTEGPSVRIRPAGTLRFR